MNASRSLRRRLQDRLRSHRKTSPTLQENYRIAMKSRRTPIWTMVISAMTFLVGGPLALVGVPVMILLSLHNSGGPVLVMATVGFAILLTGFWFAELLMKHLHHYPRLAAYAHLPFADGTVAWDVWRYVTGIFGLVLYGLLLTYGVVAFLNNFELGQWIVALLLAVLHWCVLISFGTWLTLTVPRWQHLWLMALLVYVLCLPWFFASYRADIAATMLFLIPTSWPGAVLHSALMEGDHIVWILLLPVAAVALSMMKIRNRLLSAYSIKEYSIERDFSAVAILDGRFANADQLRWHPFPDEVDRTILSKEAARQRIRERDFRECRWECDGWVERLVHRFLTPIEQTTMNFLTGGQSTSWTSAAHLIGAASLLMVALRWIRPVNQPTETELRLLAFLLGFLCLACLLAVTFQHFRRWNGLSSRQCGTGYVTRFAEVPVNIAQIHRTALKTALVRAAILFLLVLPGSVAWLQWKGIGFAALCGLVFLSAVSLKLGAETAAGLRVVKPWYDFLRFILISATYFAISAWLMLLAGWVLNNWAWFFTSMIAIVVLTLPGLRMARWLIDNGRTDCAFARQSEMASAFSLWAKQSAIRTAHRRRNRELRKEHGLFWKVRWLFGKVR